MKPFTFLLLLLSGILSSKAQQASLPSNYTTILTTPSFRVISVHYGPHEKVPVHDHPEIPTVYVYLNNSSPVRIDHAEEAKPFSIVRPPTKKGAFRVSAGSIERHSIENLGDLESNFLRVELLDLPLGDKNLEFRGPAPAEISHNRTATEFSSPRLSVSRTICIKPSPCQLPPSPRSSVLVALSTFTVSGNSQPKKLELGSVISVSPGQSVLVTPDGSEPAHLLQISVPSPAPPSL
jgi:hypothetical protein